MDTRSVKLQIKIVFKEKENKNILKEKKKKKKTFITYNLNCGHEFFFSLPQYRLVEIFNFVVNN